MALALLWSVAATGAAIEKRTVEMNSRELHGGFEARGVALSADRQQVGLDSRCLDMDGSGAGVLVSDPIDVGPRRGLLGLASRMLMADIRCDALVPPGARLQIEARNGSTFFDQTGWSDWQSLGALTGTVSLAQGRFLQTRLRLKGRAESSPSVRGLTVVASYEAPVAAQAVQVEQVRLERIVRSPVAFNYERPDQPALKRFFDAEGLEQFKSPGVSDFEQLVRLTDWVGSCRNDRQRALKAETGSYPWAIDSVFRHGQGEDSKGTIFGHCMSYAEVLVTAATALGYKARHVAAVGFREASHEVVEIWVPSMGKWVHFDPSLTSYYFDLTTGEPLNVLDIHRIVIDRFLPAGRDMNWFTVRDGAEQKARVRSIGGKTAIGCRLGPWTYGAPMPADYDWGYYHGYLAYGFFQVTPRNDFHSHPDTVPSQFEHVPGYAGFPFWVDERTPPKPGVTNTVSRARDLYWTLDQASLRLETDPAAPAVVNVEFGQSMPFFARYAVEVDGARVAVDANPWRWRLHEGVNRLAVRPVDEFGATGAGSSVTLRLSASSH